MIWLGATLVSIELEPDPIASYQACNTKCSICIDSCPQCALDGITINQKSCREVMTTNSEGGGTVLSCNICRKVCPHNAGIYEKKL
jgi:epoxyqueuosine reductase QueG